MKTKKNFKKPLNWIIEKSALQQINSILIEYEGELICFLDQFENNFLYYKDNQELLTLNYQLNFLSFKTATTIIITLEPTFPFLLFAKKKLRCAIIYDNYNLLLARRHNDLNCLIIDASWCGANLIKNLIYAFLTTEFEAGRHSERLKLLEN
jgi:hypothetical protein